MKLHPTVLDKVSKLAQSIEPQKIKVKKVVVIKAKPRTFFIPNQYAKTKQKHLYKLLQDIQLPKYIFSKKGSSFVDKAKYHLGDGYLINTDIKSFYPSVHYKRIENIFMDLGVNNFQKLTYLTTCDKYLPLGFVTSPFLGNLVLSDADQRLNKLCEQQNIKYSRYVDDLTFSSQKVIDKNFFQKVKKILKSNGFTLNEQKTKTFTPSDRKVVLGLKLLDNSVDITEEYLTKVKDDIETLKLFKKYKIDSGELNAKLKGELSFIKSVNEETYQLLKRIE